MTLISCNTFKTIHQQHFQNCRKLHCKSFDKDPQCLAWHSSGKWIWIFTLMLVCERAGGLFLPFRFFPAYHRRAIWQTQPLSSQRRFVFARFCTAQGWRYLMFMMPERVGAAQHARRCEIVGRERESSRDGWRERQEGVESERHGGKSPRTTRAHLWRGVQWCCGENGKQMCGARRGWRNKVVQFRRRNIHVRHCGRWLQCKHYFTRFPADIYKHQTCSVGEFSAQMLLCTGK